MTKKSKAYVRPRGSPSLPPSLPPPPLDQGSAARRAWLRVYYTTDHWKACSKRKRALNPVCELCRRHPTADVHHKHYFTLGCEQMCDLKSLCTLCHKTHHKLTSL